MDIKSISAFLYFGYVPEIPDNIYDQPWVKYKDESLAEDFSLLEEVELVEIGVKALRSVFRDIKPGATHVVPISGGFDSRAILAGLLEHSMADNVTTVTYGTPGTLDFEIGKYISKKYGLKHKLIDLTKIDITQSALIATSKQVDSLLWIFHVFYNRLVPKQFGPSATYWSGYLVDRLSGLKRLPFTESATWEEAVAWFINTNRFTGTCDLFNPSISLEGVLPTKPLIDRTLVDYDDQLSFAIRQQHIKKVLIDNDYNYQLPFLKPEWLKYITNIPRTYKKDKYLYRKILIEAFPSLFSEPQKLPIAFSPNIPIRQLFVNVKFASRYILKKLVSPRTAVHPGTNYIDFDNGIRYRSDLREVAYYNINDLKKRRILTWIDIDKVWKEHMNYVCNHGLALTMLTSLEIYLKSKD